MNENHPFNIWEFLLEDLPANIQELLGDIWKVMLGDTWKAMLVNLWREAKKNAMLATWFLLLPTLLCSPFFLTCYFELPDSLPKFWYLIWWFVSLAILFGVLLPPIRKRLPEETIIWWHEIGKLSKEKFAKNTAPEHPQQGVAFAVVAGLIFLLIAFVNAPFLLKHFGWWSGNQPIAVSAFVAIASATAVAPITILAWYWRHYYKKRDREHDLLTLATTSLADPNSPTVRMAGLYSLRELVEIAPHKITDVTDILGGFIRHRYWMRQEGDEEGAKQCSLPPREYPDLKSALRIFSGIWQDRFDNEDEDTNAYNGLGQHVKARSLKRIPS